MVAYHLIRHVRDSHDKHGTIYCRMFSRQRRTDGMYLHRRFYVYILASRRNGTLYTGVTSDLIRRVFDHKNDVREGFTSKYGVHLLAWFEVFENAEAAITREKRIKRWRRKWKLELIEKENPHWLDLYDKLTS